MKYVSVFMDVEDPINPAADGAALELAQLFTEAGIRGSFCLTGEKSRVLAARKRTDIVDAFLPHCLGLHTDTHSFHPTTMEILEGLEFEDGCRAAIESEQKGFDAFYSLFQRAPSHWGGAGNTWSPEITVALKTLGIPAYVYALTALPNQAVHSFNGVWALPQAVSVSELDWHDAERGAAAGARSLRQILELQQPWVGVFVGHPTKLRHRDYWDVPYFAGRTPPCPEFTQPVSDREYDMGKTNLRSFLLELGQVVKVIGVDEVLNLPWEFCRPLDSDMEFFRRVTAENLRAAAKWPPHHPGLDPEKIVAKTMALSPSVRMGSIPSGP